jgi:hypothetical protein
MSGFSRRFQAVIATEPRELTQDAVSAHLDAVAAEITAGLDIPSPG